MIPTLVDFQIYEEGIEIFHEEISIQSHPLGIEMRDYKSDPRISLEIHQGLSVIQEFFVKFFMVKVMKNIG